MPNDINATSSTATPSFSLGIAPNYLGVVSLVNSAGEVLRRWRLQHSKCTIGSDRQATIWLDDNKIASFHALLVIGSNNAIIKSFGPGLRLNGQSIQESTLRVGDRVELLGYQFLIESLSNSPLNSKSGVKMPDASSAIDTAQLNHPQSEVSTDSLHLAKLEGRVDQLLQRLGDIDDKITKTSSEQKNDFSRQCDSLRSETEHLRRIITQDFTSQLRNMTDDLERQGKARESRFDSKLQGLSDDFKNLCSDVESSFDNLQKQTDQRWIQIEQSQQNVDSRIGQLETLQQQTDGRFSQLEALNQASEERFAQLQNERSSFADHVVNAPAAPGVSPDEFNSFQERIVDLVQSIHGDIQDVRHDLDAKLDQVQQNSNDRLAQIEAATAALSAQVSSATQPTENTQPEVEALQARLTQLESVLADLAATIHDRTVYSPANPISTTLNPNSSLSYTPSSFTDPSDDIPRHDNYKDFVPEAQNLKPNKGATTQRFNSDTTTPYSAVSNAAAAAYDDQVERDSVEGVYQRYVESLDSSDTENESTSSAPSALPAWFTQSQNAPGQEAASLENTEEYNHNSYSSLLRNANDNEEPITPIAHWSTASAANASPQADESFEEDVDHSPILRSLLREEVTTEESDDANESPMFNQKDWDESDSYMQSERPSSVTALDILRASYGDANKDQFDDEQEDKWVNKLQQFSDAIHEEPDHTLSEIGQTLSEEPTQLSEESPTEEEPAIAEPEPAPAPKPTPARNSGSLRGKSLANSAGSSAPAAAESAPAGDDDSVEMYMQRLLARMRGDEPEEAKPIASASTPSAKAAPAKSASSKAVRNTYSPLRKTRQDPAAALIASRPKVDEEGTSDASNPTDEIKPQEPVAEVTVARSAPEKASDLAALRELANDSARAAVKTSDKKVKPISNTIKLTIAGLAAAVGVVFLVSNGLRVNLTLVASAIAFMLSAIWTMDVVQSVIAGKKRDQNNSGGNNNFQKKIAGKK